MAMRHISSRVEDAFDGSTTLQTFPQTSTAAEFNKQQLNEVEFSQRKLVEAYEYIFPTDKYSSSAQC